MTTSRSKASTVTLQPLEKAKLCLRLIEERKAFDPVLLQLSELSSIADFFLIASGSSTRQVQAVARHLQRRMKEEGFRALSVEGEREGTWVLLDYGEVVIHLFYEPVREFYDLESLWVEAPRIEGDS